MEQEISETEHMIIMNRLQYNPKCFLPDSWIVKFMVKQRVNKNYHVKDFVGSFITVGLCNKCTNSIDCQCNPRDTSSNRIPNILYNYSFIPTVEERSRGIVTIFKQGIESAYEDKNN